MAAGPQQIQRTENSPDSSEHTSASGVSHSAQANEATSTINTITMLTASSQLAADWLFSRPYKCILSRLTNIKHIFGINSSSSYANTRAG